MEDTLSRDETKMLVDRLLKVEAALTISRNTLANVHKCLAAIEFRHGADVECKCPVCADIRGAQEGMKSLTGAVIARLEEIDER